MPITGPDPGCLEADELGTGCDRPTVLVSAVALIDVDGRVLITKRPEGKAMAGLLTHVEAGWWHKGQTLIFVHTGGTPALFAYADALL